MHINHGEPILSRNHIKVGYEIVAEQAEVCVPEVMVWGKQLGRPLNKRRRVNVELPDFAIRAIQWRVEEANTNVDESEEVTFNDVVEWLIVSEVTIKKMPLLEQNIPGFTAAMSVWLLDATYQPDDE